MNESGALDPTMQKCTRRIIIKNGYNGIATKNFLMRNIKPDPDLGEIHLPAIRKIYVCKIILKRCPIQSFFKRKF